MKKPQVVELLNIANANQYYANHARWTRRPYASWQNNDSTAEVAAIDPLTGQQLEPFRNHMRIDVTAVVNLARQTLQRRESVG
mmetsp:Transcript_57375/g.113906  ORF Transcript_57375/g.113906 Transcript_57375/m.113906 type:complete len:83 (-) Transcript_57375:97-345(-)|eukprot:CAMPEP_0174706644 /NCGR_PEP_ID=MMETSP1094-20130205/9413_1 /TAXON_ID=156173 /ORGANISM="Chrysochromulina brevifilum, Strain UTEX LB 985" /LENGTH=82 /DNA_ID=CAMNT_0015904931 /DNA_START=422 /DNA_END=670 /DNA_ORIENTATION=-